MENMLNLDAERILNQVFDIDFKGYSAEQVDRMLDQVIEDYQTYAELVSTLKAKIAALESENAELSRKLIEEEGKARARQDADPILAASSNVDILKRLSRLEKQVFDDKNKQ